MSAGALQLAYIAGLLLSYMLGLRVAQKWPSMKYNPAVYCAPALMFHFLFIVGYAAFYQPCV